jgi:transcriptional regulator with XRE-family HTH domain
VADTAARLGVDLHQLRELRRATLRDVAEAAAISPTYLLKLEKGMVQAPSPHVLRRLARYFGVSYLTLMQQAGYDIVDAESPQPRQGILASTLASETLTEGEQRALAAFLTTLRAQARDGE